MRLTKRLRWRLGFLRVSVAQVRKGRPPEAGIAYERLRDAGIPVWRAFRLLAAAYEAEVASMIAEERTYDHERYLQLLDGLPSRPAMSLDAL